MYELVTINDIKCRFNNSLVFQTEIPNKTPL